MLDSTRQPAQVLVVDPRAPEEQFQERRALVKAVAALNQSGTLGSDRELSFLVDPETHRLVVRIVDSRTDEIVSQIPPDQVLHMASALTGHRVARQADQATYA